MIEDNRNNVLAALDVVLEGIEAEIEFVNRHGARIFEGGDHQKVKDALERAEQIKSLGERIDTIRNEWTTLFPEVKEGGGKNGDTNGPNGGRLHRGVRTPEKLYYRPILESVKDQGGSAPMSEVLERVLQRMKDTLRDIDFKPLASTPDKPRWRNTAAWARSTLVDQGLLRSESRRGVWEISDAGIQFLQRGNSD